MVRTPGGRSESGRRNPPAAPDARRRARGGTAHPPSWRARSQSRRRTRLASAWSGKRLQLRLHAIRERIFVGVEQHRDELVVARYANQIDDAALTELRLGRFERLVADLLGGEQLGAEVVDRLLVGIHAGWTLAGGDRLDLGFS